MRGLILFLVAVMLTADLARAENGPFMVELELSGKRLEGTPLAWSKSDVFLLARDGHLWSFHPDEAKNYRKTSDHFISFTMNDMRGQLKSEYGKNFEVSSTTAGNYLVVHPRGERNTWAKRFDELYRSYMQYFTARGCQPTRPKFPLVAVVCHNRQEFLQYAQSTGAQLVQGTLGFYSPETNRILLYDVTAGNPDNPNWQMNAETIVHEAIHQMAFNTGIHNRYSPPPRWVGEGLGTFFEARGVSNSDRFAQQSERVNRYRLDDFRKYVASRRPKGALAEFISSDRIFQSDVEGAYAEAWSLTFYLFETQPKRYVEYLLKTAARPNFSDYRAPQRLADFQESFGPDLRQIETRYLRFIANLK